MYVEVTFSQGDTPKKTSVEDSWMSFHMYMYISYVCVCVHYAGIRTGSENFNICFCCCPLFSAIEYLPHITAITLLVCNRFLVVRRETKNPTRR